jgi:hypothetical protein
VFDEILVEWDRYILVEWDRYIYVEVLCEKISNAFPINAIKIYDEVKDQWIDKPKDDKGKTPHHIKKLKVNDQPNLREMIKERNHNSSIQLRLVQGKLTIIFVYTIIISKVYVKNHYFSRIHDTYIIGSIEYVY